MTQQEQAVAERVKAEMEREHEAARLAAAEQLPAAEALASERDAIHDRLGPEFTEANRALREAEQSLVAVWQRGCNPTESLDATVRHYARAQDAVRAATVRRDLALERVTFARNAAQAARAEASRLAAVARGYSFEVMQAAQAWLSEVEPKLTWLRRHSALSREDVECLRAIAAGKPIPRGGAALNKILAKVTAAGEPLA